jgi:hypothetical protein
MTNRISTGGTPGVCHHPVCEKTHRVVRWPLDQSTVTVCQRVSARAAQACRLRWRCPVVGLGPRLPCGCGPGGC